MFFQKSIISLVAAIALATSVSASSIAARQVQCPAGLTSYCCPSPIPFSSLPDGPKGQLPNAAPGLDQSKEVCENFSSPPGTGWYCVLPPLLFPHRLTRPCTSPSGTTPLCCAGTVTAGQYFSESHLCRYGACLLTSWSSSDGQNVAYNCQGAN